MKKTKKLLPVILTLAMGVATTFAFTSCDKNYTTAETDTLISQLQSTIDGNKSELDEKIAALTEEYQAKDNELLAQITANQQALATLKTDYEAKIAELTLADETNAKAITDLETEYLAKVEELVKADSDNAAAFVKLKSTYESKIAALEKANSENKKAIADLENDYFAKVEELAKADSDNATALAELKSTYESKVAALEKVDSENKQAVANLTSEYTEKVEELENKIAQANETIASNKTAMEKSIASLKTVYETKVEELETLIITIQNTDKEQNDKITELEKQVADLMAVDTYTVIFDSNGGEAVASQTVNEYEKLIRPAEPTKDGWLFDGWYIDGEKWSFNGYIVTENMTLTARWVSIYSWISFDEQGGDSVIDIKAENGSYQALPLPIKENSLFLGWYLEGTKIENTIYVAKDVELTAKWQGYAMRKIADDFVWEGNTIFTTIRNPQTTVDFNGKITVDENCSWTLYQDEALTIPYANNQISELTVGANNAWLVVDYLNEYFTIYKVEIYRARYAAIFLDANDEIMLDEEVPESLMVSAPDLIPTKDYYDFSHWAVDGEMVIFPYTLSEETIFTPIFTPTQYSISYETNGGTLPAEYETSYTVLNEIILPTPTRSLYLFEGWYETRNFTGVSVEKIPIGNFGNKTYYAKWKSATNGIIYTLSDDGQYYSVTGYEGEDTKITIPANIEDIPVAAIGNNAFTNCVKLTNVIIADSIKTIGASAFEYCFKLTNVTIADSIETISASAFEYCDNLTSVYYKGTVESWCNISFGNAFANPLSNGASLYVNNELVTELEIPNTVTEIKDDAFSGCSSLTSVVIGDSVTSIGDGAFSNCDSLTSVKISDSVTSIGASAFYGCRSLISVVIPDSVTSIGASAFYGCRSLISVVIPDGVTSIYGSTFYNCSRLTSVVIPESVTSIGGYAFYNCESLTSVKISDSVTSIGDRAFYGCSSLISVVIPDSVTSIGASAFGDGFNPISGMIYCEAASKPSSWHSSWERSSRSVYWYSETAPALNADGTAYDGSYWHYDESGEIVVWVYVKPEE